MSDPSNSDVQDALTEVRKIIEAVVRKEQHRNDLTKLPNELALNVFLDEALERNEEVWCALIEVDHFKRLNRVFMYWRADSMLMAVGEKLQSNTNLFPGRVEAFHAHGDEFYLAGRGQSPKEDIARGLGVIRQAISGIQLHFVDFDDPMRATVTIGWALKADLDLEAPTARDLKVTTEVAVAHGKRNGRDQVAEFNDSMERGEVFDDRDDCAECGCAFTVEVERDALRDTAVWYCPNCRHEIARPPPHEGQAGGGTTPEIEGGRPD